jgi:hypothetical protein
MDNPFDVLHLSVERLLQEWRWLCPEAMALVARNAFGDLFLRSESGKVFKLNVAIGQLTEIAESEDEFRRLAGTEEKRREWLAEEDEMDAAERGLVPGSQQCIAFKIPLMLAQSGTSNNVYLAALYEQVSFLGDLNRQTSKLPDGTKVRLVVGE